MIYRYAFYPLKINLKKKTTIFLNTKDIFKVHIGWLVQLLSLKDLGIVIALSHHILRLLLIQIHRLPFHLVYPLNPRIYI